VSTIRRCTCLSGFAALMLLFCSLGWTAGVPGQPRMPHRSRRVVAPSRSAASGHHLAGAGCGDRKQHRRSERVGRGFTASSRGTTSSRKPLSPTWPSRSRTTPPSRPGPSVLRPNLTFTDGTPFNAAAVVQNIKDQEVPTSSRPTNFALLTGMTTPNDNTVVFQLLGVISRAFLTYWPRKMGPSLLPAI